VSVGTFGASGQYYSDSACTTPITSTSVSAGASQQTVYLMDGSAETANVTLSATGLNSATLSVDLISVPTPTWQALSPATIPAARWSPQLVFDSARGTVIMYGGSNNPPNATFDDMWEWDGTDWTQLCTGCAPGKRASFGMVYDSARDKVVIFGGQDDSGGRLGDLWEWDGTSWTSPTVTGTAPSARRGLYMSYDSTRSKSVIFAGRDASGILDDVYEYDGTSWSGPLTPATRPSARQDDAASSAATFDPIHGRMLVYGGCVDVGCISNGSDDLWAWDGTNWTELCAACTGTGRSGANLTYDSTRDVAVLSGGWLNASGVGTPGTWELNTFTGNWTNTDTINPTTRDTSGSVYDPAHRRIVLFGGNGVACGGNCNDTFHAY
jgi:hypothetical protein